MTTRYILALDQGTTSSRAIVFDQEGGIVALAQRPFEQLFPQPGWVEHRPEDIWNSQIGAAREALRQSGLTARDIAAIGLTNQRETTLIWDRTTGEPLGNAIVWQCRRTAARCDALRAQPVAQTIQAKTGLVVDAYFSASKAEWLLEHWPDARRRAEAGELAFGTVDTWLLWQLTGGRVHATDVTNASRTMLFDIHQLTWDAELCSLFSIPMAMLPTVVPSSGYLGETSPEIFGDAIPISGLAGDQQAALFGQMCARVGMAKNTYGTGCFLLLHTGTKPCLSQQSLLSTVAWRLGDAPAEYALEGSVFIAGAAVQWLRDGLQLIGGAAETEAVARSVPDTDGVVFVPAFVGLGAPYWDPHARGLIAGLTRGTTRAHLVRAALEAIAYQTRDVVEAMLTDARQALGAGFALTELRVDGGAAANDFLMQFQADVLGVPVVRPTVTETTAAGAAYLAGLGSGFWRDLPEVTAVWRSERIFTPSPDGSTRQTGYAAWLDAVRRTQRL
ncbi:MAG: glycerol kinase GlpK [Chloracidobacterium sp.]|uniref:Glycerol kinase n=1 Tax=Chloracidobacterium validum TaxID=2821543 RepID=A0ABX8BFF5_9BACT|nr:glycerol kinase GlpK [Chloracidobacterium validum]QUW03810.1 glycerol kinase GlpK [Chloracidobacterium validum]